MSNEVGLKTRTNEISAVFNLPNGVGITEFINKFNCALDELNANGYWYCGIIHDKDTNKDGELKRPHIHCVFICKTRPRLSTFLYLIGGLLGYNSIDELNTIQLQKVNDMCANIQYLTHKNDSAKYQYDVSAIFTNLDSNTFNEYYSKVLQADIVTTYQLVQFVLDGKTNTEIMCLIGCGKYALYRKSIEDIRKDFTTYGSEYLENLKGGANNV